MEKVHNRCRNAFDPLVMVDDSETDVFIARRVHALSGMSNPFAHFPDGPSFLAHLDGVARGETPMPALVLLDINMPLMNGFEVLKRVREREAFREIPFVVMLTNSDNPADLAKAEALGGDGFATKPTGIEDYVAFLKSLAA